MIPLGTLAVYTVVWLTQWRYTSFVFTIFGKAAGKRSCNRDRSVSTRSNVMELLADSVSELLHRCQRCETHEQERQLGCSSPPGVNIAWEMI
eukprot:1133772-Amphidinium_carterae.1